MRLRIRRPDGTVITIAGEADDVTRAAKELSPAPTPLPFVSPLWPLPGVVTPLQPNWQPFRIEPNWQPITPLGGPTFTC